MYRVSLTSASAVKASTITNEQTPFGINNIQLIPLLLCASVVTPAPQQNSNITYVKRQLELEYPQPDLKPSERESRIEKVPLTIPGNVDKQIKNFENSSEIVNITHTNKSQPTYNYSDRIYSIKTKPKKNNSSTEKSTPSPSNEEVTNSDDNIAETKDYDIVPAESILNDRVAANDSEIVATESDELVTERYEEELTVTTEAEEDITKAPTPRLLPKLSYFEKSTIGSFSQNLIATSSKRKFRSRCRCEKIWNCAKLQISVPRCPEEYFLCCS